MYVRGFGGLRIQVMLAAIDTLERSDTFSAAAATLQDKSMINPVTPDGSGPRMLWPTNVSPKSALAKNGKIKNIDTKVTRRLQLDQ